MIQQNEVVIFGRAMLRTLIIGCLVAILIGVVSGTIFETTIFLVCLMPLRQYAGGFHLQSKLWCAVLSIAILLGNVLIIKYLQITNLAQILIVIIFATIILRYAPVDNSNNRLEVRVKQRFRFRTKMILGIECIVFFALFLLKLYKYSQILALVILLTGMLLLAGIIENLYYKIGDV